MHGETVVVITHAATGFPVITTGNLVAAFSHHFFFHLEEGWVVI